MATIIICDGGCGAQSPDYNVTRGGPHVANGWLRVIAGRRKAFDLAVSADEAKLFCDACAPRIEAAMNPNTGRQP